jgi:hypothetical protein
MSWPASGPYNDRGHLVRAGSSVKAVDRQHDASTGKPNVRLPVPRGQEAKLRVSVLVAAPRLILGSRLGPGVGRYGLISIEFGFHPRLEILDRRAAGDEGTHDTHRQALRVVGDPAVLTLLGVAIRDGESGHVLARLIG